MQTTIEITPLACPKCGSTGEQEMPHLYIESSEMLRNIAGIGNDGKLYIRSEFRIYDTDSLPKLRCSSCNHQWDVPKELEVELEDDTD